MTLVVKNDPKSSKGICGCAHMGNLLKSIALVKESALKAQEFVRKSNWLDSPPLIFYAVDLIWQAYT